MNRFASTRLVFEIQLDVSNKGPSKRREQFEDGRTKGVITLSLPELLLTRSIDTQQQLPAVVMEAEKGIQDSVIRSLAEYIASPDFQRHFEQFFLDHALTFTDEQEHRLDYMEIYLRFQEMFNKCMDDFLASVHISEEEFGLRCQKALKNDPKAEQYLEVVIASMDYDAFYNLMKAMRSRASLDHIQADAKDGDDDGDVDVDDDAKTLAVADDGADGTKRLASNKCSRDCETMSDSKDSGGDGDLGVSWLNIRDDTKGVESKDAKTEKESAKELK